MFMSFFRKDFLHGFELPHDAVPALRSNDNRRAAGAVNLSAFRFHYEQQTPQEIVGPAARHSV
jgi:hypothetical protein